MRNFIFVALLTCFSISAFSADPIFIIRKATNGEIASFDPQPTTPPFTLGATGPYIGTIDKGGSIVNLCTATSETLSANTTIIKGITYQWYSLKATKDFFIIKGSPGYSWGSWTALKGSTSRTYTVDYNTAFASTSTLHVMYACVASYLGNTVSTNLVAFSRADTPVIDDLSVSAAYVCVGEDVVVDASFEATGDQVDIYWERESESVPGVWQRLPDAADNFSFPGNTYIDGTYDYRLAIDHSCVTHRSTSLHDFPVIVQQANSESYVSKSVSERTVSTCLNSDVEMSHSISGYNSYFSYTHSWEYLASGSSTWTKITSSNGGVFSGYNTLSLTVTPNSETYHNMQFRCTTIGACETIVSEPYYLELEVPANITAIQNLTDTVCAGETVDFTAIVDNNPLAAPIEYRWRVNGNLAVGQSFSSANSTFSYVIGTDPISVTCEVQNGNECSGTIDYMSKTIYVYGNPEVTINLTRTGCGGFTADLTAEVIKGKAPYSYLWNIPPSTTETTKSITNKASGETYTVNVTDACSNLVSESVLVTTFPALSASYSKTDVLCNGQTNGSFIAAVVGGTVPYDIVVTRATSGAPIEIANYIDTIFGVVSLKNLQAGDYSLTATDDCGSVKTIDFSISQPNLLQSLISEYTNVTCVNGGDGEATVSISGGQEPYTISWINGQKTATAIGLFPGSHTVNITDNNGCFTSSQVELSQPEKFDLQVNSTNLSCNASNDGVIDVLLSGGTLPYSVFVITESNDTLKTQAFNNLSAGNYTVVAKDNCGFVSSKVIAITQPEALQYSFNVTDVSCFNKENGSVELQLQKGVAPYTINWELGSTSNKITGLDTAYYVVSFNDACSSYTDSAYVSQPDVLEVELVSTDISCNGLIDGSAFAQVAGGTAPYSFNWSNGQTSQTAVNISKGKHTVNVIDAKGCIQLQSVTIEEPAVLSATISADNVQCFEDSTSQIVVVPIGGAPTYSYTWSNDFVGDTIKNVPAGNYSVVVKDICGDSIVKTVSVFQPEKLVVSNTINDVSCFGLNDGAIQLEASMGKQPYTVEWSNSKTTFSISNLEANSYEYIVKDACGDSVKNSLEVLQPDLLNVDATITNVSCFGEGDGGISLQAIGGVEPYVYNWNFGIQSKKVQALFAGVYSVNVFDANACLFTKQIEITEPEALSIEINTKNTECEAAIGSLEAVVKGGVEPYTYQWSTNSDVALLEDLNSGSYEVTVTDAHACTISNKAYVNEFAPSYNICVLTVDSITGKNKIVWEKIHNSAIKEVNIHRMVGGVFQYMGSVDSTELSYYDDELSMPEVVAARYAITTTDGCGNESEMSPFHQTIHLGAAKGVQEGTAVLDWTKYIDESGEFNPKWYYLYRGKTKDSMVLFDSVDAVVSTEYNDLDPQGALYYKVGVKKDNACVTKGLLKEESGPFSLAMSNIAESELAPNAILDVMQLTQVYPNPSSGKFVLEIDDFISAYIDIYTIGGENILSKELTSSISEIDLSNYSTGIYSLIVTINEKEYTQQIVVQK